MKKIKDALILFGSTIFVGVLSLIGKHYPVYIGCPIYNRAHLLVNTEFWLRTHVQRPRGFYLLVVPRKTYNSQILKMIKRHFPVIENDFIAKLLGAFRLKTPKARVWIPLQYSGHGSWEEWNSVPPQIVMTEEERRQGQLLLKHMGVPPDAPFVGFYARDSRYLNEALGRWGWEYHSHRDSSIENYLPAMEWLVPQGYWALRMGALVEKPIAISHPKIIDYATTCRSEFMDVFLADSCRFFVGDTGGFTIIPVSFNKPCVWVNTAPLESVCRNKNGLVIFKKYRERKSGRILTIKDIFERGMDVWAVSQKYEEAGIDVIENSPEEITDAVMEMHLRLAGSWVSTSEDERLQEHFRALIPAGNPMRGFPSRVGAAFLRNNLNLLGELAESKR